jgi:hypothetical protein
MNKLSHNYRIKKISLMQSIEGKKAKLRRNIRHKCQGIMIECKINQNNKIMKFFLKLKVALHQIRRH